MKSLIVGSVLLVTQLAFSCEAYAQPGLSMPMRRVDTANWFQDVFVSGQAWVWNATQTVFGPTYWNEQLSNLSATTQGSSTASVDGASATSILLASALATTAQGASTFLVNDTCDLGGFDTRSADPDCVANAFLNGWATSQGTYQVGTPPGAPGVTFGVATVSMDFVFKEHYGTANGMFQNLWVSVGSTTIQIRSTATGWEVFGFLNDAYGSGTIIFETYGPNFAGLHLTATERFAVGSQFSVFSGTNANIGGTGNANRIPDHSTSFGVSMMSE